MQVHYSIPIVFGYRLSRNNATAKSRSDDYFQCSAVYMATTFRDGFTKNVNRFLLAFGKLFGQIVNVHLRGYLSSPDPVSVCFSFRADNFSRFSIAAWFISMPRPSR